MCQNKTFFWVYWSPANKALSLLRKPVNIYFFAVVLTHLLLSFILVIKCIPYGVKREGKNFTNLPIHKTGMIAFNAYFQ